MSKIEALDLIHKKYKSYTNWFDYHQYVMKVVGEIDE